MAAGSHAHVRRAPPMARLGPASGRRCIRAGTLRTAQSAPHRGLWNQAGREHQLGHVHGPPQRRCRTLRRSDDVQCGTLDGPQLRFFELSGDWRGLPRRHDSRSTATTRPFHGARGRLDHRLRGTWRWQAYAALAGEPALGPPGYPHRASAMVNPIGPVTHHWLDSTHVTFGVVTVGVHNQRWKVETSAFNGREPDESRVDLDLGAFDSVAARLSYLPTERLALQVSAGRLREAWSDFPFQSGSRHPSHRICRVSHAVRGKWNMGIDHGLWGKSRARDLAGGILDATTAAALLESSITLSDRHTVFGRGEVGGMPAHHLHAHEYSTSVFAISKVQLGYVRHLNPINGVQPGIGGTVSLSFLPAELAPRYSGRTAPSVGVFFSLQAARHQM